MREVAIIGVGMHPIGKHLDKTMKDLSRVAVWNAIEDAQIDPRKIEVAYVGNSSAGVMFGQESIKGHIVLRDAGFSEIPIVNVEGACASGGVALYGAWLEVASGNHDVALALGFEKMFKGKNASKGIVGGGDVEVEGGGYLQPMASYAMHCREWMQEFGWTQELFAKVEAKNKYNGSLNPYAQYQIPYSEEEILKSRVIAWPLTLLMCAPIGDGAAAVIVCDKKIAKRFTSKPLVTIASFVNRSPRIYDPRTGALEEEFIPGENVPFVIKEAYEKAGVGPEDVDVIELHNAASPAELIRYVYTGVCKIEDVEKTILEGRTRITGDIPVNPSGGSTTRGHAIGATGLAQTAELVWQLRGEAKQRQVKGRKGKGPRIGLLQNSGGFLEQSGAAVSLGVVLKR